ncbi:MAG: hypothetical protein HY319_03630 [Armatimonadetes bacterium]|nr:hypothetical protein [Armatimonadota bacterium]
MRTIWISSLFALLALMVLGGVGGEPEPAQAAPDPLIEFFLMAQEVQSINLVQGLYLSEEQAAQLEELARRQCESRARLERRLGQQRGQLHELLGEMRSELLEKQQVTPATRQRHDEVMARLAGPLSEHKTVTAELVAEARKILNENQLELVARYNPCLVPPDPSQESRVGQSSGSEVERGLRDIRQMPGWMYPMAKRKFLGDLRTKLTAFHGAEEAQRRIQAIEHTMDRARSLSDEEFAQQKAELVGTIHPEGAVRCGAEIDKALEELLLSRGGLAALERLSVAGR